MVDEDGEHLICHLCAYELKQELDLWSPEVFGTTLEERRKQIRESKKEKKQNEVSENTIALEA
jgi:hypothetical protein